MVQLQFSMHVDSRPTRHGDASFETHNHFAAHGPVRGRTQFAGVLPGRLAMTEFDFYRHGPWRALAQYRQIASLRQFPQPFLSTCGTIAGWIGRAG